MIAAKRLIRKAMREVLESKDASAKDKLKAAKVLMESKKSRASAAKRKSTATELGEGYAKTDPPTEASQNGRSAGRFNLVDLLARHEQTMYDGPQGALLREYHDVLGQWSNEFRRADRDLAVVDRLWADVLSAYRLAFGKEASPEKVRAIRLLDDYDERERLRSVPKLRVASSDCGLPKNPTSSEAAKP
jgi:hypothetical protein